MKILRLELAAFGLFTNKILDLSAGNPGLHILYGANEAGKSTMRRALSHVLFGIPERTLDAHFHANEQLRVGAHLRNSHGEELICYRRKGRKNTLLDADNNPLDETDFQTRFLGGMNEAQFTALFCFDHEQLRQGGNDLLSGGGAVGESLFEAGTGSLKIHDILTELDKQKEELFKARGTKPLLNQTIKVYKDACKRIKDCSLSVNEWSEQAKKLDEAQQQHTYLTQQLQQLRAEQHRLERIQRTRPLLQRHQELKAEWAQLQDAILLPDDAATKHFQAKLSLRTAQTQEKQAIQDIAQLQSQLGAIQIPQALLIQKAIIDDLRGRLGSHQKAARDLPGVRTEMRTVEGEARILLQRLYPDLDLPDIATKLTITNPQRERVKQLAAQAPALYENQRSTAKRLEEITEHHIQQQQLLEKLPLCPDLTLLRATLTRACKYSNLEELQSKDEQEVRRLTEQTEINLRQLGLWSGQLEALERIALPKMDRIDSFDRRFKEIDNDQQRIKERLLEARRQNELATKKINALRWAGEIPTEEALLQARQIRQTYWQTLKQSQITSELCHTFEEALAQADEIADRLRREANRVAEYSVLLAEQHNAQREQELQTKKWHTTNELLANLQTEWEECWKPLGIKPWSAPEMRSWLSECFGLRQQASLLRERRQQLQDRRQLIAELCRELTQALLPLQPFLQGELLTHLPDLIAQGEACVNEVTQIQRQNENLQLELNNLIKEKHRIETARQQINSTLKQWQTEWAQALMPLHLPADTSPETARNGLNDLDQVVNKLDKMNGLRRRVDLMCRDAELFRQDVATLAQKVAPELVNEPAEQVVPELSNRLSQTEKEATRYEQLQHRLQAEQQRLTNATQQVQVAQAHLQALLEQAHCHDLAALESAEQASTHKKTVQRELIELEQQLLEQGEGLSLTDLANAVATVDIDQLPGQLHHCTEQTQQLEQERSEIDQYIGELRTLLKQMDGNAAAAQAADEAQLALAEMQELSERYMQIHLAASVLRKSIERYREQHQGPLLTRASELFQQLTLNSFYGLKTDYNSNNDQPILVGLRTFDNAVIQTTGMSDGTRDQLYLALRLASIERYLEKNSPLPLILDDILINFDDERSRATLSVFGKLCQKTQILFLTHHPHLVELAQTTLPNESLVMHRL
ncbi:hypothetical protein THII_2057 [Thioploca ingrica]|uniref:YhaN AAA domain-containing protein n=1 Tax=Thioploca ingrica TaxID=40754 RepID=A0A090AGQ5_9GAMM|nr:hypothetical protein THII_2057 [Thioploca ingrica]